MINDNQTFNCNVPYFEFLNFTLHSYEFDKYSIGIRKGTK